VQSRVAAFRMRIIHRLLYGSSSSNWKVVACEILKSLGDLGFDKSLVLMDPLKIVWNLFDVNIGQIKIENISGQDVLMFFS